MSKVRSWQVTAQAHVEDKGEQTITTFIRANNKKNAEKAGLRSILHRGDIYSVESVTASVWTDLSSVNPEVRI